ncbi:uncharacterized protein [Antedon mediterranea]|uniref:uncharacterized protein n=1 Tax=Antedon mediterranea TaxID=105859 RepID=UPI003AF57E8D
MDKNKRNDERKKRLNKYHNKFVKTVDPLAMLGYFPKMHKRTKEGITCRTKNDGHEAGAEELLMKLTKADSDWYDCLMEALKECEYEELLNLLKDDVEEEHQVETDAYNRASSTSRVEQTVSSPHQESSDLGSKFSQLHSPAEQHQRVQQQSSQVLGQQQHQSTSSQIPTSPALTPLSPVLPTSSSIQQYSQQRTPAMTTAGIHQPSTPTSPRLDVGYGGDYREYHHSHSHNKEGLQRRTSDVVDIHKLTLGQAKQGVREAFNKRMNHNLYPNNNWKSLAANLDMSVDEVDNIQDASEMYEKLKTSGMKLVELVERLQELKRVDLVSDIRQFHNIDEIKTEGKIEGNKQVSQIASDILMMREQEGKEKENYSIPDDIKIENEHGGSVKESPVKLSRSQEMTSNVGISSPALESNINPMTSPAARKSDNKESNVKPKDNQPKQERALRGGSSLVSCGETLPYVPTSLPVTLRDDNQPPFNSQIAVSEPYIPHSVLEAQTKPKEPASVNVDRSSVTALVQQSSNDPELMEEQSNVPASVDIAASRETELMPSQNEGSSIEPSMQESGSGHAEFEMESMQSQEDVNAGSVHEFVGQHQEDRELVAEGVQGNGGKGEEEDRQDVVAPCDETSVDPPINSASAAGQSFTSKLVTAGAEAALFFMKKAF